VNETWIKRFMDVARLASTWSKDPSTQVGAAVVGDDKIVRAMGFNGFPRGVRDAPDRYADRAVKYKLIVHAEANALLNAHGDIRGCTLFATKHPCAACAALIIQAGIAAVYCPRGNDPRWEEEQRLAEQMFSEAGVDIYYAKETP
jgi:dCMP deaminase